jgi:hypothetical protein
MPALPLFDTLKYDSQGERFPRGYVGYPILRISNGTRRPKRKVQERRPCSGSAEAEEKKTLER